MLSPAILCQDPGPIRHRWLVAHVLTMAALQISHPITIFILMKTNNRLLHGATTPASFFTCERYTETLVSRAKTILYVRVHADVEELSPDGIKRWRSGNE